MEALFRVIKSIRANFPELQSHMNPKIQLDDEIKGPKDKRITK